MHKHEETWTNMNVYIHLWKAFQFHECNPWRSSNYILRDPEKPIRNETHKRVATVGIVCHLLYSTDGRGTWAHLKVCLDHQKSPKRSVSFGKERWMKGGGGYLKSTLPTSIYCAQFQVCTDTPLVKTCVYSLGTNSVVVSLWFSFSPNSGTLGVMHG